MRRASRGGPARVAVALALAAGALGACASSLGGYAETLTSWRAGDHTGALAHARAEYQRFREGNDLSEQAVRAAVDGAMDALAERPIVPRSGPPAAVPMDLGAPGALRDAVRADLLSGRVTPILRACASTAHLGLRVHAPDLITVIFRRDPVTADGGLLAEASVALRSVAAKRAALDALEALAHGR